MLNKRRNIVKNRVINFQSTIVGIFLCFFILLLSLSSCTNPFAPKLADPSEHISLLSDQKTVNGVFQNFRLAYIFKDTIVYGKLLDNDFTFVYHNFDLQTTPSWGRDEDMLTTNGLFQAAQNLDLTWNDVTISTFQDDSLTADIWRAFTLTIVFSPTDILRFQGRANFKLHRNRIDDIWKIQTWIDESNNI